MRLVISTIAVLSLLTLALMFVPSQWHLVFGFTVGWFGLLLFPWRKK